MGVPAFFRWLCKKYPSIVVQCAEEKSRTDPNTEEKIPLDLTQPNPNGIEFDNLYLDMNGIIHPCTHPEDRPAPKNENEMMVIIFEFIDRLFAIVRPRKLLYMAIDGVAPRAKMNQQRSRRFRAAKDSYEKSAEIRRIKEQILANGGVVPPDVPQSEKFDSNCITPGTPFMHRLAECLRYYVYERVNSDPAWSKLTVILSDANVPGEGEHKIMDFIRRQRANPDHDPNTHHVLCGADADLIMLGLATHEPHFTIIREEFRADRPRPCEVCNQFGHDSKECQGLARVKAGQHDELASTFVPSEQRYIFLRLNILREYLNKELFVHNLPFTFDIERAIDDWVFMCFFVGNDFLPHLPSLEIREGAIDRLVTLYKNMISRAGGYLTDCGDVHLERVQIILAGIGDVEDDIFKRRQRNELEFRQRNKDRRRNAKERSRVGDDMPLKMPEWMKSGPFAPTPLGNKPSLTPLTTPNKFEALEKSEPGLATTESAEDLNEAESDESKRGHKRKLTGEPESPSVSASAAAAAANKSDPDGSAKKKVTEEDTDITNRSEVVVLEEEEEDEDANDHVRLWEDGWKQRYYKIKFNVEEEDFEFRRKIAHHYTIGLQWVLKYYYQGVPSWNWYFPYHYAPFASDFVDIAEAVPGFNEPTEPFKPFEQLMAVFPAASKQHIPKPWQQLMTDENSVIIDFYPEDFQVDLNGKKQSWQGVALLPFVDEARLKKALLAYADRLSPEEKKRNTRGYDRIFVGKQHPLYEKFKQAYAESNGKELRDLIHSQDLDPNLVSGIAGKFWFDEYAVMEGETYPSPIQHVCPAITNNHVLSMQFHDPVYDNEYIFKANILEGAVFPDATLKPGDYEPRNWRPNTGFRQNNDYRNNRNPNAANRMVQNSLGGQPIDTRDNRVMSSAYGGQGSNLYGAYRSSPSFNNNNQQQQQQQGNNNYYYNYNSSNSQQQQQQNRYQNNNNNNNNYSNYGNNLNQQNNRNQGYNNNYNNNNNNYQQQRYQSTNNNNQYNNNRNNNYNSNNRGANNQGNNQGQQQQQQRFNRNNNNNYNNNNSGKPYN